MGTFWAYLFFLKKKKSLEYAPVNKKSPVNILVCDIEICAQKTNKINKKKMYKFEQREKLYYAWTIFNLIILLQLVGTLQEISS